MLFWFLARLMVSAVLCVSYEILKLRNVRTTFLSVTVTSSRKADRTNPSDPF